MTKSGSPLKLLKHLQFLTDSISNKKGKIYFGRNKLVYSERNKLVYYINIYSKIVNKTYLPIPAKNEGIACVDDCARAILLALEIYEFFEDKSALDQAEKWLSFLEYMQDDQGYLTNFIDTKSGRKKYDIPSSFKGGPWWSARAKWAWAKAYKLTNDIKYLNFYFKTKIMEGYESDVSSVLLLAGLEILENEKMQYFDNLIDRISSSQSPQGYLIHGKGTPLHLWGYHELEALVKSSKILNKPNLLSICKKTVDILVEDVIENDFYFEYERKDKREVNPYCVSPLVRGLYELYKVDRESKYLRLIKKCLKWFEPLYDPSNGRCFDWVSNGEISTNAGAEASCEAGFCRLRGLKLGLI